MNTVRILLHPSARLKGWCKRPQISLTAYGIVYEMCKYLKALSLNYMKVKKILLKLYKNFIESL